VNVALFCHSILSDWNHGNAHFLRGVVRELLQRGHTVQVFEPENAWSVQNLVADAGPEALDGFRAYYPPFAVERYELSRLDLDAALDGVHLVIVHEWNTPELVQRLGAHRARGASYRLLFHDTHHRMLTAPEQLEGFDFSGYDGVLAFGEVLRQRYQERGWGQRVFTWHEAADTRLFRPGLSVANAGDLVWIGNWGDEERSRELAEYLLEPVRKLALSCSVYGVRYPMPALEALSRAGAQYQSWLPNYRVPAVFAGFRVTVHVPRRPYVQALPGIPTIRPFEALACGIPLVSAPWSDSEQLFRPGRDFLMARDGAEMQRLLREVLLDRDLAFSLASSGLETIASRHTCAHRVDELLQICRVIGVNCADTASDTLRARASARASLEVATCEQTP